MRGLKSYNTHTNSVPNVYFLVGNTSTIVRKVNVPLHYNSGWKYKHFGLYPLHNPVTGNFTGSMIVDSGNHPDFPDCLNAFAMNNVTGYPTGIWGRQVDEAPEANWLNFKPHVEPACVKTGGCSKCFLNVNWTSYPNPYNQQYNVADKLFVKSDGEFSNV